MKHPRTKVKEIPADRFERHITARNARYDAASPASKRVILAIEVLRLLKAGVLEQERGTYLRSDVRGLNQGADARTAINKGEVVCTVCAKGALFIAACSIQNQLKIADIEGSSKMGFLIGNGRSSISHADRFALVKLFGADVTEDIEYAFENRCWTLATIMRNIIRNRGEFKAYI